MTSTQPAIAPATGWQFTCKHPRRAGVTTPVYLTERTVQHAAAEHSRRCPACSTMGGATVHPVPTFVLPEAPDLAGAATLTALGASPSNELESVSVPPLNTVDLLARALLLLAFPQSDTDVRTARQVADCASAALHTRGVLVPHTTRLFPS